MLLGSILLVKYTGDLVRELQQAGPLKQQASGSCPFKMEAVNNQVEAALLRIEAAMTAVLKEYEETGQQQRCWAKIQEILSKEPELVFVQILLHCFCGVHPNNRGGMGFLILEAISTGLKHLDSGYSLKLANHNNWACMVDHSDPKVVEMVKFNDALSRKSGLQPLSQCQVLTFAGSHRVAFLRAISSGMAVIHLKWAASGKLDPVELAEKHPDLKQALQQGLTFNVMHAQFVKRWPQVVDIASKAENVTGAGGVTELEGIATCKAQLEAGADSKAACKLLEGQQPFFLSWVPSLCAFAACVASDQLQEAAILKGFIKQPLGAAAQWGYTGGEYLQKVADLKLNLPLGVPRVKMACYMAALNCPVQHTSNGQCKFIFTSEIARLQSKKELAMPIAEAEKLLNSARDLSGPNEPAFMAKILALDCEMIYHLLGKKGTQIWQDLCKSKGSV